MVQPASGFSMTQNPDTIEHPSLTTSEVDFQSAVLPFVEASDDIRMDELWELADATVAETRTPSLPSPLMLPAPMIPVSPSPASPREGSGKDHYDENATATADSQDHGDPVSLLRVAGDMVAAGRTSEAKLCRKRAMLLMQVVT